MKQKLLFAAVFLLLSISSFSQAVAYPLADMEGCNDQTLDLTVQTQMALGNQDPQNFSVGYFLSDSDAEMNTNPIAVPSAFIAADSQVIFVRVTNLVDLSYQVTNFSVHYYNMAEMQPMPDVAFCDGSYLLPPLPAGNYYLMPHGQELISWDTVITSSRTIYLYNGPCVPEYSFHVTDLTNGLPQYPNVVTCADYVLPPYAVPGMHYHTGPGSTGVLDLLPGDVITTPGVIYTYFSNGSCELNGSFTVDFINAALPQMPDVTVCDAYVLPALTLPGSTYHTTANGGGTVLQPGAVIVNSSTVYVYFSNGVCTLQDSFEVTINPTPVITPPIVNGNAYACDSYMLPTLTVGEYYADAAHTVPLLNNIITATQTVYIGASNGICSVSGIFNVMISQTPLYTTPLPETVFVCPGETTTLHVAATGENLEYQWFYNDSSFLGTGPDLTVGPVTAENSGRYRCNVRNMGEPQCGSTTFCQLMVGTVPVLGSPQYAQTCPGDAFSVAVDPALLGDATYQWSRDGVDIEGATNFFYGGTPATFEDSGLYHCVITGSPLCGGIPITAEAYLFIGSPSLNLEPLTSCLINNTAVFNLSSIYIPNESPVAPTVSFYTNQFDAQNQVNPIQGNLQAYAVTGPSNIVFVRVDNLNGMCTSITTLALIGQECSGNTISGYIRHDPDGNGCSETDNPVANIQVTRLHGNILSYTYTNDQGYYEFSNVEDGAQQIYLQNLASNLTVTYPPVPSSYVYNMQGSNTISDGNFCLATVTPTTDATLYLYSSGNARPGMPISYYLIVYNNGNTALTGVASLTYDTTMLDYNNASPALNYQVGNMLGFNVGNLQPYQYSVFQIFFTVNMPPTVNLGDVLHFTGMIDTVALDSNVADNSVVFNQIVVNSYDPNDICVQQGAQIIQSQVPDYLDYTIHFQNSGNAEAINVKIVSELDSRLDWSTFRPVMSSHPFTTERHGNEVTFNFANINLPPGSTNEAGSNGYVTYKIKPNSNIVLGDTMSENAAIYFDFNSAIATNTVTTELVNVLNTNTDNVGKLEMYPNPASGKVTLQFGASLDSEAVINVYDVQGKLILSKTTAAGEQQLVLDISKIQTGIYFVKVNSLDRELVKKLMVN